MVEKTKTNSIVSIEDFSRLDIEHFLEEAKIMKHSSREDKAKILERKIVASLFFEPSTRTRLSFETAIQNLGGKVIGFSDASTSSTKKGETLDDTITMVEKYADAIVMRHYIEGAARRATEVTKKPILNAGDGANQHPTQTMLDLFTIKEAFGTIDNLKIGMVGDLKYGRTVHSLATALNNFNNITVYLIAPEQLKFPKNISAKLKNISFKESEKLEDFLPEVDVLYVTRIQHERFGDEKEYLKVKDAYIITKDTIKVAKPTMKIMHPLPRVNELSQDIDHTPHALYFEQAANAIPMREALLKWAFEVRE